MFTAQERQDLASALVARARAEERIVGAALLGSSARGFRDDWSDIDLAICADGDASLEGVVADWTGQMYERHGAIHQLDVYAGRTLYRVFLLANTLQVDLSFWVPDTFVAAGPDFRQLFGAPAREDRPAPRPAEVVVGEAWLYLLHVRGSVARRRFRQADYMLGHVRDRLLELACRRHDLRADEARGVDDLPAALLTGFAATRAPRLTDGDLRAALSATAALLIEEIEHVDTALGRRLARAVSELGAPRVD